MKILTLGILFMTTSALAAPAHYYRGGKCVDTTTEAEGGNKPDGRTLFAGKCPKAQQAPSVDKPSVGGPSAGGAKSKSSNLAQ